jgi:hypothetical protein
MPKSSSFIVLILLSVVIAACNLPTRQKTAPQITQPPSNRLVEAYPVDSLFSEFYTFLGGEDTLGPAISPLIESGNLRFQYTEAGMMEYDPLSTVSKRFQLAPLGIILGVAEPPGPDPGKPGERYINGHVIYEAFEPMYERLGGARFVGRPLTEAHHNPEKRRIEQYFENLGFYQLEDDQSGKVYLLAYGAYVCDRQCRYQPPSASLPGQIPYLPEPFASTTAHLGLDFVGLTLTQPYLAEDGKMEVIFQNVVMVLDTAQSAERSVFEFSFRTWLPEVVLFGSRSLPGEELGLAERTWLPLIVTIRPGDRKPVLIRVIPQVWLPVVVKSGVLSLEKASLRPIVALVGIQAQPPVDRRNDPLMVFYKVEGEKGYHVPAYFDAYLQQYGGSELVGKPISEVFPLKDGVFRQCFTNLCLDYDVNAPDSEKLKLAPLGLEYKERYYQATSALPRTNTLNDLRIQVWESKPYVAPDATQEIHVGVYKEEVPIESWQPVLTVTMPDNQRQVFTLEPTDERGETSFELPPIAAPNGTLITYEVCLEETGGEPLCVGDQYMIWEYP